MPYRELTALESPRDVKRTLVHEVINYNIHSYGTFRANLLYFKCSYEEGQIIQKESSFEIKECYRYKECLKHRKDLLHTIFFNGI